METIQVLPIRVRVTAILRKALLSGEYRPGELAALQQWAMGNRSAMNEQEYRSYNQQFHTALWKAADNQKLFQLLSSLWNGPSTATQQRDLAHEALSICEHQQILRCIKEGAAESAKAAMEAHIRRSMGNILLRFRQSRETLGEEKRG